MEVINYLKRVNGSGHIVEHVGWHESGDYMLRLLFESGNGFRQHKYEVEKEYSVIDKAEVDALERQTCGSRGNDQGNPDYWRRMQNGDRTCSFCGSIHPDDLITLIKQKGLSVLGRSDKGYKFYIERPEVKNAGDGAIKYYTYHNTPEFVKLYNELILSVSRR